MRPGALSVWVLPLLLCGAMVALVATVRARSEMRSRLPDVSRPAAAEFPVHVGKPGTATQVIAGPPQKILLANVTMVDIVTQLVGPERIVALPEQALTWSRLVDVDDGFRARALFRSVEPERVISFEPDLVLCSNFNTLLAGPWTESAGIPVVSMHAESLDDLRAMIGILGDVLGVPERERALQESIDTRVEALESSADARRGLGAIAYSNLGAGGYCSGRFTLADDMIRLAGMRNLAADLGKKRVVRFTFEDIVVANPDVIVIPRRFGELDASTYEVLVNEPSLADVRAIRDGRIVRMHPRLFSTGSHEIVLAAEQLAAAVDAGGQPK